MPHIFDQLLQYGLRAEIRNNDLGRPVIVVFSPFTEIADINGFLNAIQEDRNNSRWGNFRARLRNMRLVANDGGYINIKQLDSDLAFNLYELYNALTGGDVNLAVEILKTAFGSATRDFWDALYDRYAIGEVNFEMTFDVNENDVDDLLDDLENQNLHRELIRDDAENFAANDENIAERLQEDYNDRQRERNFVEALENEEVENNNFQNYLNQRNNYFGYSDATNRINRRNPNRARVSRFLGKKDFLYKFK